MRQFPGILRQTSKVGKATTSICALLEYAQGEAITNGLTEKTNNILTYERFHTNIPVVLTWVNFLEKGTGVFERIKVDFAHFYVYLLGENSYWLNGLNWKEYIWDKDSLQIEMCILKCYRFVNRKREVLWLYSIIYWIYIIPLNEVWVYKPIEGNYCITIIYDKKQINGMYKLVLLH